MIEIEKLEAVAKAALAERVEHDERWPEQDDWVEFELMSKASDFVKTANPAAVLELIAEVKRITALNHQQFGDAIRKNAERDQLKAENERLQAAAKTLTNIGYRDCGGELWKPPLGKKPDFDLIDSLRAENEALRKERDRLAENYLGLLQDTGGLI